VAADGAHQLAHERVPLEMQAADGFGTRKALVYLQELEPFHEGQVRRVEEIAFAVGFGEVSSVVAEPGIADHLDFGYGELGDGK